MNEFKGTLYVVQTNDNNYVHTCSFHVSEYGAAYQCAHDMNEEYDADNALIANSYQIVRRELEI